jgi:hypothetical protein
MSVGGPGEKEPGRATSEVVIESGCKQFKERFGRTGMRWSRQGAINLMPVRAAVMGRCFDRLFALNENAP